ncbi:Ubiquitin-conjugating enzyme family protein [Trichomonas vaginalis G3]|uniref:Ubiquitin-conjugating enzyme family protein n=1 Tax=Trichomonas vaginalis (strain ATCC PRA-98 / G3) TaxID=412133 RepID=A2FAR7_TRIV3|nr:protein modification by small protein conjugation [Trichomonas vaginalis G3]EAX97996.1 Ubiquitin-conjugating enzyme family protein [Trichomonas vaginalis G3]KAI5521897.1 protein modification by small protein conjugation [Trichomonas vaginalis G3]|eukprot:XP_001310926.1 Ubiquitin-conjugating enzyme family protein [Trichomonas vaginalis G3]
MRDAQRILKELRQQKKDNSDEIWLESEEEDIRHWYGMIKAPEDTAFAGHYFKLDIVLKDGYPIEPPQAKFITKIFHPNISFKDGTICLDILKTEWTPAWTINSLCTAIRLLLSHPEPDSPLNTLAGNLLRYNDQIGYDSMAKFYADTYAPIKNTMKEAANNE